MKGKGKGNPIDANTGRPLRCHACGSEDHLIDRCPEKCKGKGKGAAQGSSYFEDYGYGLEPGREHLAGVDFQYTSWPEESVSFMSTDRYADV